MYNQAELDDIADSLKTRPRKALDWRTPLEVYAEVRKKFVAGANTLSIGVALGTGDRPSSGVKTQEPAHALALGFLGWLVTDAVTPR